MTTDKNITEQQMTRLAAEAAEAGDIESSAIACRAIGRDYSGHDLTSVERARVDAMTADECRMRCEEWIAKSSAQIDDAVEATDTTAVAEIADILKAYGELFHGGRADEVAAEWIEAGVTDLDAVDGWCQANVWEPRVAAALQAEGVSPQRLCDIAAKMTRGMSADERRGRWTEGCPIYAACDGDISVDDLIAAL